MSVPDVPGVLLLCLDLQAPFLEAIPQAEAALKRTALAIAAAELTGVPVAFTEQVPAKLGPTRAELLRLAPAAETYPKSTFSALADEVLQQALQERKIEHLLLCGIETPICVYQTAIDALNDSLQVTVLADAVAGRRPEDGRVALEALARAGVHVLPVETVFYALLRDARHPAFKRFTELVKRHV